jgi:hypothetical protein
VTFVYYFAPRDSVFDTIRVRNAARERITVAIEHARRNLPPALAGLAMDELGFPPDRYVGRDAERATAVDRRA